MVGKRFHGMKTTLDVSIIIVNYNTKDLTCDCLKSVFKRTDGIAFEVIVSDNGSTDGSQEMIRAEFPEVILIENGANLGFGAANNRALAVARGKYVFYLNSDTVLLNNAVKMFFDYWENSPDREGIGALGANLLDGQGRFGQKSSGLFCEYKQLCRRQARRFTKHCILGLVKILHLQKLYKSLWEERLKRCIYSPAYGEVDVIFGAALFLKNDLNAVFDENFFLYSEEVDLELRMYEKGLKRILIDGPQIVHYAGCNIRYDVLSVSTFSEICAQISDVRYSKKNLGKKSAFLLRLIILADWLNPFIPRNVIKKALELNKLKKL